MKENQKAKLCKHCKTELPTGAKVCPNCKKKQGGIVKWIIIGVVAIAVIGGVAGNSEEKAAEAGGYADHEVSFKAQVFGDGYGKWG